MKSVSMIALLLVSLMTLSARGDTAQRSEELLSEIVNKVDSYTPEQVEECKQVFEDLIAAFHNPDLSNRQAELTQNFTSDHYAFLAAASGDCLHLKNALAALTGTNSEKTKEYVEKLKQQKQEEGQQQQKRGPWGHTLDVVAPTYLGCDSGPMRSFIAQARLHLIDTEPKCENGPNGDYDLDAHGAWIGAVAASALSESLCEGGKAACVSTLPGAPCIRLSVIPCAIKSALELVELAAFSLIFKSGFQDQMVVDAQIGAAYRNSYIAVNALRCKNVTEFRRHHGCNGQDENCDGVADDCGEDVFEPEIRLNYALVNSAPYFTDPDKAVEFATRAIQVEDDCTKRQDLTFSSPVISGSCSSTVATITATDGCGNMATVGVPLSLDTTPPSISCRVAVDEIIPDKYFPEFTTDVGFSVSSDDDCGDTPKVSISVFSTELSSTQDVFIKSDKDGNFQSLEITSRFNNFQAGKGRVYTIYARATNKAGMTDTCSVQVNLHPRNKPLAPDTGATYLVASL